MGKNSKQGKTGLFKSFDLMAPNGFEVIEVEDEKVEAVFINKRILAKIAKERIIPILKAKVFKFVSRGELLKVSFKISISYNNIKQEFLE